MQASKQVLNLPLDPVHSNRPQRTYDTAYPWTHGRQTRVISDWNEKKNIPYVNTTTVQFLSKVNIRCLTQWSAVPWPKLTHHLVKLLLSSFKSLVPNNRWVKPTTSRQELHWVATWSVEFSSVPTLSPGLARQFKEKAVLWNNLRVNFGKCFIASQAIDCWSSVKIVYSPWSKRRRKYTEVAMVVLRNENYIRGKRGRVWERE